MVLFASDHGLRKHLIALALVLALIAFSFATIWPPKDKITLGLDIKGGTSFLIRMMKGDKEVTKGMLEQAVEVIRKRVDYFGGGEPIISPVGADRIPRPNSPASERRKSRRLANSSPAWPKLEFRLVYPDNGERLRGDR